MGDERERIEEDEEMKRRARGVEQKRQDELREGCKSESSAFRLTLNGEIHVARLICSVPSEHNQLHYEIKYSSRLSSGVCCCGQRELYKVVPYWRMRTMVASPLVPHGTSYLYTLLPPQPPIRIT
jgi:hypothetical protein